MNNVKVINTFILMMFFGLVLSTSLNGQNEWVKFQAEDVAKFSVYAPAELGKKLKEIPTAVGTLKTVTYVHEGLEKDPNYLYSINMVQYPEGTFPEDSTLLIQEFLDGAVESCWQNVSGELVYSTKIDEPHNGVGRLFRVKHNEEYAIIKGKTFIKGDTFIMVQVFTTKVKSLNSEMDEFLDSFVLKP